MLGFLLNTYVLSINSQFPNIPITQNISMEPLVIEKCSFLNKDSEDQIKEPKHLGYYLISTLQVCFHTAFILLFILLYLSFVTLLTSSISQISIKWEEAQCYFDLISAYRLHSVPIQEVLSESSPKPRCLGGGSWGEGEEGTFCRIWVQDSLSR